MVEGRVLEVAQVVTRPPCVPKVMSFQASLFSRISITVHYGRPVSPYNQLMSFMGSKSTEAVEVISRPWKTKEIRSGQVVSLHVLIFHYHHI